MKKSQVRMIAQCSFIFCALLLLGASPRLWAQAPPTQPGNHPMYLHAIDHLRQARDILQIPYNMPMHKQAAAEALPQVEHAIDHLKVAARIDDKSLADVPPPDNHLDEKGKFHKVAELLQMAHHDLAGTGPESDPQARPLRDQALRDIDQANAIIQKVIQ
jgi:hypothetical protein